MNLLLSFCCLALASALPELRQSGCGNAFWKGDTFCDDENNNEGCAWDGGDCCGNDGPGWDMYCGACECLDPAFNTGSPGGAAGGNSGDCTCGVKNPGYGFRISGGNAAAPHEYPWQVALVDIRFEDNIRVDCGGTLLNDQYVLTSGFCVNSCVKYGDCTKDTLVRVGAYNQKDKGDDEIDIEIEEVFLAPGYARWPVYKDDIAIIKLASAVTFDDNVRPICLPTDASNSYAGDNAVTAGWGILKNNGYCVNANTGPLFHTDITVLSAGTCGKWEEQVKIDGTDLDMENCICAGGDEKGPCSGDSGGALMIEENGAWFVTGVTRSMWGPNSCGVKDYPGVFTRVTSHLDWINGIISSGMTCSPP